MLFTIKPQILITGIPWCGMSQRNSFPPDFWAPMARLAQACSSLFKGGDGDGDDGGDDDNDGHSDKLKPVPPFSKWEEEVRRGGAWQGSRLPHPCLHPQVAESREVPFFLFLFQNIHIKTESSPHFSFRFPGRSHQSWQRAMHGGRGSMGSLCVLQSTKSDCCPNS